MEAGGSIAAVGKVRSSVTSTVLAPSAGGETLIRPFWLRIVVFFTLMAAVVLSQTRGVYLTALWTLGLSAALRLGMRRWFARLASAVGA